MHFLAAFSWRIHAYFSKMERSNTLKLRYVQNTDSNEPVERTNTANYKWAELKNQMGTRTEEIFR